MKNLIILLAVLLSVISAKAQVPYFGTSEGKGKLETYFQWKGTPGENDSYFYASAQYGLTDKFDIGFNHNGSGDVTAIGVKYSPIQSKHLNLGIQPLVDFKVKDSYKYSDYYIGLYLNGTIANNWNYVSNTWYTNSKGSQDWDQWTYIYYNWIITPVIGCTTHISDNCKTDLAGGFWTTTGKITWYVWGSKLINKPKLTFGLGYKF